jgi:hypothetical protein
MGAEDYIAGIHQRLVSNYWTDRATAETQAS